MKVLFLDIDGVLNDYKQQSNGYCGIGARQVGLLNDLIFYVPDLKIVLSSAWRYLVLSGSMRLDGMENLLLSHGIKAHGRVHGVIGPDLSPEGHGGRETLIRDYVRDHQIEEWAVIDDLPLEIDNFFRTQSDTGLTNQVMLEIRKHFSDWIDPEHEPATVQQYAMVARIMADTINANKLQRKTGKIKNRGHK